MELTHVTATPQSSEERAARAIDTGGFWTHTWLALRAGVRLLLNPRDTEQAFLLATAVDRPRIHKLYEALQARPAGRALLAERPAIDSRSVDFRWLRSLPADSLGGAYARALEREQLDPDLFQPPPLLAPEFSYVVQRVRQTHDLWHVLTGLSTDIPGEVALQAFTTAQIHSRTGMLIAVFGTLFFGLRHPGMLRRTRAWHAAGKRCAPLLEVRWEDRWEQKLEDVRAELDIVLPAA